MDRKFSQCEGFSFVRSFYDCVLQQTYGYKKREVDSQNGNEEVVTVFEHISGSLVRKFAWNPDEWKARAELRLPQHKRGIKIDRKSAYVYCEGSRENLNATYAWMGWCGHSVEQDFARRAYVPRRLWDGPVIMRATIEEQDTVEFWVPFLLGALCSMTKTPEEMLRSAELAREK